MSILESAANHFRRIGGTKEEAIRVIIDVYKTNLIKKGCNHCQENVEISVFLDGIDCSRNVYVRCNDDNCPDPKTHRYNITPGLHYATDIKKELEKYCLNEEVIKQIINTVLK